MGAAQVTGRSTMTMPPAKTSAEKKSIVERAEVECCESRFDVKKLTWMWKHKLVKKQKRVLMFAKVSTEKVS